MARKLFLLIAAFVASLAAWFTANPIRVRAAVAMILLVLVVLSVAMPGVVAFAGDASGGGHQP